MGKLCECGCGKEVNKGKRFVWGHNSVEAYRSPEMRDKVSKALMGHVHSAETRAKISKANKGKPRKGTPRTEAMKRHLRELNTGKKHSKETNEKRSRIMREKYLNGEFKPGTGRQKGGRGGTTIEIKMEEALKGSGLHYKKQPFMKGVGFVDFSLPESKLIIECDGDYWHTRPGAQERDCKRNQVAAERHGYRTLRFWEHEINSDIGSCMQRIFKFAGKNWKELEEYPID